MGHWGADTTELTDMSGRERPRGNLKIYSLEVALQKEVNEELGEFSELARRAFSSDKEALDVFENQRVGRLLLGNLNRELGEYVGNFRVKYRILCGDRLLGEGDKNQMQYAAECTAE